MDPVPGRSLAILSALARHEPEDRKESMDLVRMLEHGRVHPAPCDRHSLPGHFTASALVASLDLDQVLLIHHRRLGKWLQCGGHMEVGDRRARDAALREAREETGIADLWPHPSCTGLLDVDIHTIPSAQDMPEHEHLDLRYLMVADPDTVPTPSNRETRGAKWVGLDEAERMGLDPGIIRMLGKLRRLTPRRVVNAGA